MKTNNLKWVLLLVAGTTFGLTSCKKEPGSNGDFSKSTKAPIDYSALPEVHLSGVYTSTRVLSPDTLYLLDGVVCFSGSNARLYIKAGTHVVTGNPVTYGGTSLKGVLVITKNARIYANGNQSNTPLASYNPDSTIVFGPHPDIAIPNPGDFGGVIILGNAPTNLPQHTFIEGIPPSTVADLTYGGAVSNDNSGVLRFARIEYAGFILTSDNEINGLTLGGVGSGTTINHVQVSFSNDDSFEFFGGTVNADHLVALAGTDDDFDFDNGYSGNIRFAIALKDPYSPHAISGWASDANGIESDNNIGSTSASLLTRPTLSNFTILGYSSNGSVADLEKGAHFRRLSGVNLQNSIIGGYATGAHFENITTTGSAFQYNVVHAYTTAFNPASGTGVPAIFANNQTGSGTPANTYLKLGTNPFYTEAAYNPLDLRPLTGSPALTGGNTAGGGTSYRGAIDPAATSTNIWTLNWTDFTPSF
ncbi:hypothetical protein BDE36_2083 [Arcticibacter tournemirensis]|uniref:T9SS C-terminal target domain-containing protein n=1 Tax=Arcticibacter tournemirensis TaxID=699437 RepID=A0A5M9HIV4_9SPHI|nr:hypothetical protein [Arcticibacter tournemirensis]KAA8485371.1 hypothetical protein F1649_04435 [Arcticibacter tournemirensis]TQM50340.1 hypothetical protein BDE36_2083 [Arcticibacter tournemirensis]